MSFLSNFGNILGQFQGMQQIQQGAELQAQGAEFQASLYRQGIVQSQIESNYNLALEKFNRNRELDTMARSFNNFIASNRVSLAAAGRSLTSQSALMVQVDVLNTFEREATRFRNSSKLAEEQIKYQQRVQATELENRARQADFEAQVARFQGEQAAGDAMSGIFNSVFSMIG